ncbi:MAG: hypothetical protein JKY80_01995 [Mariprofundaceae bacterium]|nr:hypothetical protein [Mariprofundaceae bacterium]
MIDIILIIMFAVPTLVLGGLIILQGYGWWVMVYYLLLCVLAWRSWYIGKEGTDAA